MATAELSSEESSLEAVHIGKRFGAVTALDDVSFRLYPGRVVGLVGDNGAGKSTLVSILAGAQRPSEGRLQVHGRPVEFRGPEDARREGIEAVYQDLALALARDVISNLYMGREKLVPGPGRLVGWLDRPAMRREAQRALASVGITIPNLAAPCEELSGGQRQAVAVARALMWGSKVLLMDEPTAALALPEQRRIGELVVQVKRAQVAVVVISHNLPHVLELSDRILVLLRGRLVADVDAGAVNVDDLVAFMTGAKAMRNV